MSDGRGRRTLLGCLGVLLLSLGGCAKEDPATPPPATAIVDGVVLARNPSFGRLSALRVAGDYLWVADASGDPFVHVIDLPTGAVFRSFGRRGEGPGEFESAFDLLPDPEHPQGVVVYDIRARRLTAVRLDSGGTPTHGRIISLPGQPVPRRVTAFRSGYLGWLSETDFRWTLFDTAGQATKVDGPLVGPPNVPEQERIKASSDLMACGRPDGTMFAVAYVSAGRVELHDSTGRFIGLATVPDSSDGDFEAVAGGQLRWNSQRYYYSGCAVTDQYLFLLYSGEAESADPGGFAGSSTVQVLGWDGRFIGEFLLSVPLMRFTIDAAGDRMLGSGVEDGTIYTFDIPDRFRTLP